MDIVPGVMEYRGAKIQILDIPGIITGASRGKGRGREILSVARNADFILMILDIFNPQHLKVIIEELRNIGIRANEKPPDVTVKQTKMGGIHILATVPLTKINEKTIRSILNEYGIHSADVLIREDVTVDRFIDSMDPSCIYVPMLVVLNKIDLADEKYLEKTRLEMPEAIFIAADKGINTEELKDEIFDRLELIRLYLKPQGKKADLEEPMIIRKGSTVGEVAARLHRDFIRNFRHAKVWGTSVKFPAQKVGLDHVLNDKDVLRLIIKK